MTSRSKFRRQIRAMLVLSWLPLALLTLTAATATRTLLLDAANKPTADVSLSSAHWTGTLDAARLPSGIGNPNAISRNPSTGALVLPAGTTLVAQSGQTIDLRGATLVLPTAVLSTEDGYSFSTSSGDAGAIYTVGNGVRGLGFINTSDGGGYIATSAGGGSIDTSSSGGSIITNGHGAPDAVYVVAPVGSLYVDQDAESTHRPLLWVRVDGTDNYGWAPVAGVNGGGAGGINTSDNGGTINTSYNGGTINTSYNGGSIVTNGTLAPEGRVFGWQGSIYTRKNGGPGSTLYVKESGGAGVTGWVAK